MYINGDHLEIKTGLVFFFNMFNLIQAVTGLRKEFLLSTDEKLRIAGIFFFFLKKTTLMS